MSASGLRHHHGARRLWHATGHWRDTHVALGHGSSRGIRRWSVAWLDRHRAIDSWTWLREVAHAPVVALPLLHAANRTASVGESQNEQHA